MIVILGEELFRAERQDGWIILAVMGLGRQGRYKVRTQPAFRPGGMVTAWLGELARFSASLRDMAQWVLERGLREVEYNLTGKNERKVYLEDRAAPDWPRRKGAAIRLPLDGAALRFLSAPLEVLVENGRNDWGFLGKAVPADWRARYEEAREQGWIAERHAGGDGEMKRIVEGLADQPARRHRTWALFDSDVGSVAEREASDLRGRTAPATKSEQLQFACECADIPYHRLRRRAIENYIPRRSLEGWAWSRPRGSRQAALRAVDAFYQLGSDEQRHYLHMKEGIAKDRPVHGGSTPPLFTGVDAAVMTALDSGFGKDLADIWREEIHEVRQADLDADGSAAERLALFQALMAEL